MRESSYPVLWEASAQRKAASKMAAFLNLVAAKYSFESTYEELYKWSIENSVPFWGEVGAFLGIKWRSLPDRVLVPPLQGTMRGGHWFPGGELNFAENLLPPADGRIVIRSFADGAARREFSGIQIWNQVAALARFFRSEGVEKGDRIAGVLVNGPEAVVAMLAAASLGAVWSSCSPDFGAPAILDRLKQIQPKILFFSASYQYGTKLVSCSDTLDSCAKSLVQLQKIIVVDHLGEETTWKIGAEWSELLRSNGYDAGAAAPSSMDFVPCSFSDPLYILFSSGTTGIPKCIVHSIGGTLLQHGKELVLHCDLQLGQRLFYYTTCGWMMWNWMVSALGFGGSIITYDGSVSHPSISRLWEIVDREEVSIFGTSPKFLAASANQNLVPSKVFPLQSLRTILSTGSPLLPEQFDWVYQNVKNEVHLASISGGTDIVSCFMLGNPLRPVRAGEIQGPGLGMAVEAWDENRRPIIGVKGELVCTKPFPSMPIYFWNDENGEKYRQAYFSHYEGIEVWRHGDFVEMAPSGGIIVHGRSDATLNPGGVRIGTAEIYRQVEGLAEVQDAIAVGWNRNGDQEIVLFVQLRPGFTFDDELAGRIRACIRNQLTPRHVPAHIAVVKEIPYTRSSKKVEIAVTQILNDQPVTNLGSISNPDCLRDFALWREEHR